MTQIIHEPLAKTKLAQLLNTLRARDSKADAKAILHRIILGIPGMTHQVTDADIQQKVDQVKQIFAGIEQRRSWNVDEMNQLLELMA